MAHDYAAQKAETFETFVELRKQGGLPDSGIIHFLFYAEDRDPDWATIEAALARLGFTVERDEEEGMIDAAVGPIAVTPEAIWDHERRATEVALLSDFYPDGWDMLEG